MLQPKVVLQVLNHRLMQVKYITECSRGSFLQYFWPALSDIWSLRPLFCLFLSGCLKQVLLYYLKILTNETP